VRLTWGAGLINLEEFVTKMNLANRKIGGHMYRVLDRTVTGPIDFDVFIMGLNAFLPDAAPDQRINMCLDTYDSDGSGTVSREEVLDIIQMPLARNTLISMTADQLDALVEDLFAE